MFNLLFRLYLFLLFAFYLEQSKIQLGLETYLEIFLPICVLNIDGPQQKPAPTKRIPLLTLL